MTDRGCRTVFFLICLALTESLSSEPFTYTINTKKWSHVLDDHFISITINPTDLLQGKAFGLGMNSTVAILQGLSPAYIRIGSADTGKYTFKRSRYSGDVARTEDEFIITESHWTTLNDIARSADLDVIVCLNAAHRNGASNKWDTRNSLELISFSDSKGYNLTFQLGYEVQRHSEVSGHQFGKDLKRLRTILNAFPRYQNSKLIGPDIRYISKKEDVEFINDLLLEAGQVLDAVTWHPRWPQPSKMKVSDVSELGYEFPSDYLEWDRSQIGKILQRSVLKNSMWIGEPKTESTGTFAEGLLWARRLVLAAKLGIEVVMKQPSLMDISHPKPEYWIAYLHKRLLGRAVLETRSSSNQSDVAIVTHCSNPLFWAQRSNKVVDGAVTIYAVNMNGKEQKLNLKGTWNGKSQIVLHYLLTSGSDPDSVFSQMTYLNGEPLLMTEDGNLPDITPRVRRIERGLYFKLPPYSVGFLVVPEARVKICQVQPAPVSSPHAENIPIVIGEKKAQKNIPNARSLNQLIVDKLKNPVSGSDEELYDDRILIDDSSDRELSQESGEGLMTSRRVRQATVEDIGQELKEKIREIRDMLQNTSSEKNQSNMSSESLRAAEEKISSLTQELGAATRMSNQEEEFDRFLHQAGLNQNFGSLMVNERTSRIPNLKRSVGKEIWAPKMPEFVASNPLESKIRRFRRSISYPEDDYEETSTESFSSEEEDNYESRHPHRKFSHRKRLSRFHEDSDERGDNPNYSGTSPLKGPENKYRSFISYKIQDRKKRLNDLRRLKKKEESEEKRANDRKTNFSGSDLQEEILMKEVEVLQKTEEAMANLIKNHKKRQETIEEIILHEISDIKEDRLTALEDMRQHKEMIQEQTNEYQASPQEIATSVKDVLDVLHSPITKRSISEVESNLNGLENTPGDKKPKIIKRSADSSYERPSKRRKSRKNNRSYDDSDERENRHFRRSRSERLDKIKNFIQSRERIRDRNIFRKKHNKNMHKFRLDESDEDSDEVLKNYATDSLAKDEDIVIKEIQKEILKKPERKTSQTEIKQSEPDIPSKKEEKHEKKEEKKNENINSKSKGVNKESKDSSDNSEKNPISIRSDSNSNDGQKQKSKDGETNADINQEIKAAVKKPKSEMQIEYVPLKIDKNKGMNVLKRISNLVENINKEKVQLKKSTTDVDDLSEEFYGEGISKMTRKRPRRSHHQDDEVQEANPEDQVKVAAIEPSEDSSKKDMKSLRKEIKLQKRLERRNRRKKPSEEESEEFEKGSKARLRARLQARLAKLVAKENPMTATEETATEKLEMIEPTITTLSPVLPMEEISLMQENPEKSEGEVGEVMDEKTELPEKEEVAGVKSDIVDLSKQENTEMMPDPQLTSTEVPVISSTAAVEKMEPQLLEEASPIDIENTVLLVPEIDGIYYNPVVVASPVEIIERGMENHVELQEPSISETTLPDTFAGDGLKIHNGEKYLQKSSPIESEDQPLVQEFIDNQDRSEPKNYNTGIEELSPQLPPDNVEKKLILPSSASFNVEKQKAENEDTDINDTEDTDTGPPDLITDLLEGEKLKPWKGAEERAQVEVKQDPSSSNYQYSDEIEENVEKAFSEDAEPMEKTKAFLDEINEDSNLSENEQAIKPKKFAEVEESYISELPKSEIEPEVAGNPAVSVEFDSSEQKTIEEEDLKGAKTEDFDSDDALQETIKTRRRIRRGIDRRMLTPEERIRNFKRMSHRRHALQPIYHNELPLPRQGDSFWKMAGSTVKAVFNDVIPEAYGKTKSKIENLGIAEYFKEFGKIVEQMKNLDRLFANIGQAAVKNYIKGTEDEKGDYIQVIERKRRSRRDVENVSTMESPEGRETPKEIEEDSEKTNESTKEVDEVLKEMHEDKKEMEEKNTTESPEEKPTLRTTSAPVVPTTITKSRGLKNYVRERPNDLITDIFLMDSNPGIIEVTKSPPTTELPKTLPLQPFEPRYNRVPKLGYLNKLIMHKALKERRELSEQEIPTPNLQKFAPWMKTTKDFINQALTTLQRQRELSEMIARESVNDLVKREIERKVTGKRDIEKRRITKREAPQDGRMFSVYEMPVNEKRQIYETPNELAAKYLTQLKPGVYIIPTEEMKNLRSEQIMKEAPSTRPGTPNMVTLNIYYDKKKPEDLEGSAEEIIEPDQKNSDFLNYYQQPGYPWNNVHPPNYAPPMHETVAENNYYPPVESVPILPTEAKMEEPLSHRMLPYPEPYTEYIPTSHRGYPVGRIPQNYYYPAETHVLPGKSGWADFKTRHLPVSETNPIRISKGIDSGWAVQFQPSSKKKLGKIKSPIAPPNRLFPDKKRSIGSIKIDPDFQGLALPFWKFLVPKKIPDVEPEEIEKASSQETSESESIEEIFAENRKRAEAKKIENPSEEKPEPEPQEETEEESEDETEDETEGENSTRRKRDVTLVELHDIVPEWIGTVQELDNTLHQHNNDFDRTARIVTLPLYDYNEEDDDDDSLYDDNFDIQRMRRSADMKEDILPKAITKKLDTEDSSLEVPATKVEGKISLNNGTDVKVTATGNAEYAIKHFFRHAYDSLVQMMKGMTDFI